MRLLGLKKFIWILMLLLLVLYSFGCCKKKNVPVKSSTGRVVEEATVDVHIDDETGELSGDCNKNSDGKPKKHHFEKESKTAKILDRMGLRYSVVPHPPPANPRVSANSNFERKYLEGIGQLESNDLNKALSIFKGLLQEFPDGEEASVAELCIAEIYFRSKNNEAALALYKEIVRKYPGTQAAENAAEGIKYLESFNKHEEGFISPDVEDKRRRRR